MRGGWEAHRLGETASAGVGRWVPVTGNQFDGSRYCSLPLLRKKEKGEKNAKETTGALPASPGSRGGAGGERWRADMGRRRCPAGPAGLRHTRQRPRASDPGQFPGLFIFYLLVGWAEIVVTLLRSLLQWTVAGG